MSEERIEDDQMYNAFQNELLDDPGKHYRYTYKDINLDPFRIAKIYGMTSFPMQTILKKVLCAGERGHKDYTQDLKDIISAAQRELQMLDEDIEDEAKAVSSRFFGEV